MTAALGNDRELATRAAAEGPVRPSEPGRKAAQLFSARIIALMAGLCLTVLLLVAFARLTGIGVQQIPPAAAVETRRLLFLDAGGGAIEIRDAADDAVVKRHGPGEGGFIRTVMRGMAAERMKRGGDSATPFDLSLHANGHLIIRDPMTSNRVILNSFGKPNSDLFAELLSGGAAQAEAVLRAAGAAKTTGDKK